eukprot:62619-Prorocentrum_lima.AAC.1
MTSSLVGSGDVYKRQTMAHALSGRRVGANNGRSVPLPKGALAVPHTQAPVSYTHLTLPTICSV